MQNITKYQIKRILEETKDNIYFDNKFVLEVKKWIEDCKPLSPTQQMAISNIYKGFVVRPEKLKLYKSKSKEMN